MTKKKTSAVAVIQHGQGDAVKSEAALEKLADLVARRLSQNPESPKRLEEMNAEELTGEVVMQPWFLSREIAFAILRLLPLPHREKWSWAFSDWGCLKCGRKDAIHASLGFCRNCYSLVFTRLRSSIARHTVNGPTAEQLTAALTEKADRAARVLASAGLRDPETELRDRIDPVHRATRVLSAVPRAKKLLDGGRK